MCNELLLLGADFARSCVAPPISPRRIRRARIGKSSAFCASFNLPHTVSAFMPHLFHCIVDVATITSRPASCHRCPHSSTARWLASPVSARIISASMPESARKVAFSPLLPSATPAENQAGELRDTSQCLRRGLRPIGRNRRIIPSGNRLPLVS